MKFFCCIVLIGLANVRMLPAQTSTNAADQILALVTTNAPVYRPTPRSETVIEADGPADFEQTEHGGRVIYRDHVRVDAPDLKLRCEWLAADLSQASGRVTNIVAETNVVIDATDDKGQKMHATGDKTVYVFAILNGVTNETVTLTGDARAEYKQITLTGDPIIWDRANNRLYVPSNPKMVFHQDLTGATTGTNSPVVETNSPPPPTNSVATDTNFPPGKLDLTPERHVAPRNF